jgi:hypothetical protein
MRAKSKRTDKHPKNQKIIFLVTKFAKVISVLVAIIAAFASWYFSHCYDERKEAIVEVRNAFDNRQTAQDQMRETMAAAVEGTYRFVDYLKHAETIKPQVAQSYVSQLASLNQNADTACANYHQAINRFADAEATLSQVFLTTDKKVDRGDSKDCLSWKDNVVRLTLFDPARLNDKTSQSNIIAMLEQQRLHAGLAVERFIKYCESCQANFDAQLKPMEARRYSITNTCWDCVKILFKRF